MPKFHFQAVKKTVLKLFCISVILSVVAMLLNLGDGVRLVPRFGPGESTTYFQSGIFSQASKEFATLAEGIDGDVFFVDYNDKHYSSENSTSEIISSIETSSKWQNINLVGVSLGTRPIRQVYDWLLQNRPEQIGKLVLINPCESYEVTSSVVMSNFPLLIPAVNVLSMITVGWVTDTLVVHESDMYDYRCTAQRALDQLSSISSKYMSAEVSYDGCEIYAVFSDYDDQISNDLAKRKLRECYGENIIFIDIPTGHSAMLKGPEIFGQLFADIGL